MDITPNPSQRNAPNDLIAASLSDLDQTLKNLFFELSDALVLINLTERQIIEANHLAEEMLAYEAGELDGVKTELFYLNPHIFEQMGKFTADAMAARSSKYFPMTFKKKDGTLTHCDVLMLPFFDQQRSQTKGILILRSARQDAITAHYHLLAQNARDIVIFVRVEDGCLVDANEAAVKAYGYTYRELVELNVDQLGQNNQTGIQIKRKTYSSGILHEAIHCRKDGSTFPVEISLQDAVTENEHLLVCVIRDISSRLQAEEAHRLSETRYRSLFNSMMDSFALCEMVYDSQGKAVNYRYLEVNPAFYALNNLTEDVTGKTVSEVFSDKSVGLVDLYERVAHTGIPAYFEFYSETLDKSIDVMAFSPQKGQFAAISTDISARKHAESEIRRQVKRLEALRLVDTAIATSFNLEIVIKILLDQVQRELESDAADVLMLNVFNQTLEYSSIRGFYDRKLEYTNVGINDGLTDPLMETLKPRLVYDLNTSEDFNKRRKSLAGEKFVSYCGIPIVIKGRVRAVLEAFFRRPFTPNEEWLSYFDTLANQAAIAIENSELFNGLQRNSIEITQAYEATIEGWSRALDVRSKEPEGHTYRVTQMTMRLARQIGLGDEDIVHIRRGAILHDIGKAGIPDEILFKPGPLNDEEWALMRTHPIIAYGLLSGINYLLPALDIPYSHHEHWDGHGYPLGLKKNAIPLAARIFAVAETYDMLRSERPYRKAWAEKDVIEYIRDQSGAKFDPEIVEQFLKMIAKEPEG